MDEYLSFIDDGAQAFFCREEPLVESTETSQETVEATAAVITAEENIEPKRLPTFHLNAYTGAAMVPCSWSEPVVIELSGIKPLNKLVPIRFNHCNWSGVGHATKVYVKDGVLQADGVVSRENDYAKEVVESAKNGFPWQVSVGGRALKRVYVEEGSSVVANGKKFRGPITYVPEFELCEISFCDLGADSKTSASVVASNDLGDTMKKKVDALASEEVKEEITATPAEEVAQPAVEPQPEAEKEVAQKEAPVKEEAPVKATPSAYIAELNAARIKNENRISAIQSVEAEGFEELRAQAIEEGWSFSDFNVALKAARHDRNLVEARDLPKGQIMAKPTVASDAAIEASIVTSILGERVAERNYDENTLNEADGLQRKLRCFRDVFAYATQSPFYRDDLSDMSQIQAAFTTSGLEKIFRNVVNKSLLAGYETVTDDWRKFCSVSRATDFKPVYNYRIGGDFTYKEITNNANEISNATFSEEEYTNSVKSYALLYTITRKMLYNDDLNALADYPRRLGQGAAETLNDEIYKTLLANATCADGNNFYSLAHKNYRVATSENPTALSIDTLGQATELFETQETAEGRPIAQDAKYLFVPTALKAVAQRIINSITVVETTSANAPAGAANPFYGKYEIISSPFLQSSRYPNASNASWYLFGDPARISAIDVVFLNGVERPTIEQGQVAFDQLGIAYRGVFDFGVKPMDWRGSVLFAKE